MSNRYNNKSLKTLGRGRVAVLSHREYVRNFLRSAIRAADPQVFYFSLNGMVMPLSKKA